MYTCTTCNMYMHMYICIYTCTCTFCILPMQSIEGDMVMQQNPSFRQSHGYDGGLGGRGGHVTYQDRGSPYHQRRGKTGTAAGGDNLSFREQFRGEDFETY